MPKRAVIGFTCLFGFLALLYFIEEFRGRWAWRNFETQWTAKGEKFDFADYIPPAVPDKENFAMAPVVASSYSRVLDSQGRRKDGEDTNVVNRLAMAVEFEGNSPTNGFGSWQKALPLDLGAWQQYFRELSKTTNSFPVPPRPQTAASDVLLALSKYDSAIEEVREAAALPASRFPLNYDSEQPYLILLPHLAGMNGCSKTLLLRTAAELELGQTNAAFSDALLGLRLGGKIRSEPTIISQLVRISIFTRAVQGIWEGLANHRWTGEQLAAFDQQLAGLDFAVDYQAAFRAEMAADAKLMDYLRRHPEQLESMGAELPVKSRYVTFVVTRLVPSGWFYQNKLITSKVMLEEYLPVVDSTRQTFNPTTAINAGNFVDGLKNWPGTIFAKMLLPSLSRTARKFAVAQATLNLCRTAGALERYRLAHGKYPETLDALVPKFLPKLPNDPFKGQPLHYRLGDNGRFELYSIGWNEVDDHGTVALNPGGSVNLDHGDIVWQYPDGTP